MTRKNNNIFIACDTPSLSKIKKIIKLTKNSSLNIGYKFGLEFFNSKHGRSFISKLPKQHIIWLDLKLKDIPNTVSSSIHSLKDLTNVRYLTIHASGGMEMMQAAKQAAAKTNKKLKVLAVTVLTSFSEKSIKQTGHTKIIKKIVIQQASLAKKAKLDGIVCSGHEAKSIKTICKKMQIITPGIRLEGDSKGDQQRVMTPSEAFQNGATGIVIGRSITNGNIKKNIQKLIASLQ
ncbi:MAG: orotidine-5'-phosphate decarboxylase [Candidatus Pelagibacter sp.]|nr:orotidine-5'-phosphate decarboxylase [Candidatus Pelagibacter sp.]